MKKFMISLVFFAASILAAEEIVLKDEDLLRYGDHLYRNKEYYRAITEYKRFLYHFPLHEEVDYTKIQIAKAYYSGEDYEQTINYINTLEKQTMPQQTLGTMQLISGIAWFDRRQKAIFSLRRKNIEHGIHELSKMPKEQPGNQRYFNFIEEWQQSFNPEKKSLTIAGVMSAVFPGSGSIYVGKTYEGIFSFFLTSLFFVASQEAFKDDKDSLGYTFGFFSLAFYGGSIYTGINSTSKHNDNLDEEHFKQLRQKYGVYLDFNF